MSKRPTGWRAWGLATDADGPVLASPEFGRALPSLIYPKRAAMAVCIEHRHKPPHPDCGCGLYSASTVDGCRLWLPAERIAVVGRVELIGRVLSGPNIVANRAVESMRPIIDAALGLESSPEYRSAGVRLKGRQYLHPSHAGQAEALTERYAVRFTAADWMTETARDVGDDLSATARRIQSDPLGWWLGRESCGCGEPHWGDSGAGLLLLNRERTHVVLQRRSVSVDNPGTWALVGGAVERCESPRKAALREAQEEAGLPRKLLHVERTITPARPDCDGWTYTYVVATTHWDGTDPVLPGSATDESDGAAWCPLRVLDEPSHHFPLHPGLARDWPLLRPEVLS